MEFKGTKGKWKRVERNRVIYITNIDNVLLAEIDFLDTHGFIKPTPDAIEANANLIASAPELLDDNQTKLVMMEKWVGLLTQENPQYAQVAFEMKEEMFQSGKIINKALK